MDVERNRATGISLRRLRKRAGLTQREVAERMSSTQSAVSKMETAERNLHAYEIYSYADALGVSSHVLVDEIESSLKDAGLR